MKILFFGVMVAASAISTKLRRRFLTSAQMSDGHIQRQSSNACDPTIGKNIALAYLPHAYCQVGRELQIQYFDDVYPVKVEAVGYGALYDPENTKPRS